MVNNGQKMYFAIALLTLCVKMSLIVSYRSTDFEVHRNWLALTHSLPLKEWYFENTSIWTLDYPPFFAYFEWILSQIAWYIGLRDIFVISEFPQVSDGIVLFQRFSVIVSDFVLIWATIRFLEFKRDERLVFTQGTKSIVYGLVVLNAGLLLVDHIHFQYNGMLIGLLVLCVDLARRKSYLCLALAFSALVLFKHLFLTLAPVFAVFLWRSYCCENGSLHAYSPTALFRLLLLACIAITCLLLAFGPFLLSYASCTSATSASTSTRAYGLIADISVVGMNMLSIRSVHWEQLPQIMSRLFPVSRGLVHAYWAPNIWALYYFSDWLISGCAKKWPQLFVGLFEFIGKIKANINGNLSEIGSTCSGAGAGGQACLSASSASLADIALSSSSSSSVSGLVGNVEPTVLPSVSAGICALLVLSSQIPALQAVWLFPGSSIVLIRGCVYCSLSAFMLGYHVHEKAILVPIIMQTLLVFSDIGTHCSTKETTKTTKKDGKGKGNGNGEVDGGEKEKEKEKEARVDMDDTQKSVKGVKSQERNNNSSLASLSMYLYFLLCAAGIFGLLPLFTTSAEGQTKALLYWGYMLITSYVLFGITYVRNAPSVTSATAVGVGEDKNKSVSDENNKGTLRTLQWLCSLRVHPLLVLGAFALLHLYVEFGHVLLEARLRLELEFLPLMLTSVCCSLVLLPAWLLSLGQLMQKE